MNLSIKEDKKVSRQDIAFCLARVPNTSEIYFGSSDAQIHTLDLAEEKPESTSFEAADAHLSYITGLAMPNSATLVSGGYDRHLIWWNRETRSLIRKQPAHDKWIRAVVASPDGQTIASVADDMVCRLWDAKSGALQAELRGHAEMTPHDYPSMLYTCAFSPDGQFLATADKIGHIIVWDVAKRQPVTKLEAPIMYTWDPSARRHSIGGIRSLTFSPDGQTLVAGGMGKVGNIDHLGGKARLRVFNWQSGDTLAEIETAQVKGLVEKLAFHPNGDWLLAGGGDHKGHLLLINPTKWEIEVEQATPYHIHDLELGESNDIVTVVGHNAVGTFKVVQG